MIKANRNPMYTDPSSPASNKVLLPYSDSEWGRQHSQLFNYPILQWIEPFLYALGDQRFNPSIVICYRNTGRLQTCIDVVHFAWQAVYLCPQARQLVFHGDHLLPQGGGPTDWTPFVPRFLAKHLPALSLLKEKESNNINSLTHMTCTFLP